MKSSYNTRPSLILNVVKYSSKLHGRFTQTHTVDEKFIIMAEVLDSPRFLEVKIVCSMFIGLTRNNDVLCERL